MRRFQHAYCLRDVQQVVHNCQKRVYCELELNGGWRQLTTLYKQIHDRVEVCELMCVRYWVCVYIIHK